MTLGLHLQFDRFEFWLEDIPGSPNCYEVCTHSEVVIFGALPRPRRFVEFQVDPAAATLCAAKSVVLELPDRRLMALRAACARVAHMSGAVEQMDEILQDRETTQVLANDGSIGNLLTSFLLQSQVIDVG